VPLVKGDGEEKEERNQEEEEGGVRGLGDSLTSSQALDKTLHEDTRAVLL